MDPVYDLLVKKNVKFIPKGRDYVVSCFNPQHEDNNPSMRIDKVSGMGHCFSCGFNLNLFTFYGILTQPTSVKVQKLKQKLKQLKESWSGVEFDGVMVPYTESFRGISVETLKHFGAFYSNKSEKVQDRIFFPITDIKDAVQVYVGRHLYSNDGLRYINLPEHAKIPLFPQKFTEKYTSIVLVEGIFDMLNLYDKGVHNVICCFGTGTLNKDTGSKMLPFKTVGIEKVFLMFDGDTPGREAMKKLEPLLQEEGFQTEVIDLEDGLDPGELDSEQVAELKEYINA